MKNPLRKRILRDIKKEKGKYFAIFAFILMMVGVVSGMLVAGSSMIKTYDEGVEDYCMEDGHFELDSEVDVNDILKINDKLDRDIKVIEQFFYNYDGSFEDKTFSTRIYKVREEVNKVSLHEGRLPEMDNEIAIDRLFAENNDIKMDDVITINNKDYIVCAFVAVPDYSCLYKNNSDLMFNATTFTYALVSDAGFRTFGESKLHYGYAYTFENRSISDKVAFDASDDVKDELINNGFGLKDFLSRQNNKAITFAREDMGSDTTMMVVLLYILIVLLAFIFAIIMNSSIEKEAKEIGTLRASGFTKNELVRHYMAAPMIVVFIAAICGNILGYTVFKDVCMGLYYHSYSLAVYKTAWNVNAFWLTTVIPIILLMLICYLSLRIKLGLSPLNFLRGDFSKKGKKRAIKLPGFRFMTRFRIRVILQNMPNYITMIIGIILSNLLFMFASSMLPILTDYTDRISESVVANYQYTLKYPVEIENESAEKYCVRSLEVEFKRDLDAMVYGIAEDSKYLSDIDLPMKKDEVIISVELGKLLGVEEGDTIELYEKYGDNRYTYKIVGTYEYPASKAVFMRKDNYNENFNMDENYYTGYFSNDELTDLDEEYIYNVITVEDLTSLSSQLNDSMGALMPMVKVCSIIIFFIVIYLLAKVVLEKNSNAISLTKVLGYNNNEISGIYIVSTAVAVLFGILMSIPISNFLLQFIFKIVMEEFNVYTVINIASSLFLQMAVLCAIAFCIIGLRQMRKIKRIPMEKALKCSE